MSWDGKPDDLTDEAEERLLTPEERERRRQQFARMVSDFRDALQLKPHSSCLICGHDKPFAVWKGDVGVCEECRAKATGG